MSYPTDLEAYVLRQLANGEQYGWQLIGGSGGALRRGTVYALLAQMVRKRMVVRGRKIPTPSRGTDRQLYAVTAYGTACLSRWDAIENLFPVEP